MADDAVAAERISGRGSAGVEGRAGSETAAGPGEAVSRADAEKATPARPDRRRVAEIVRDAGTDSGNFDVGRAEADAAGLVWAVLEARSFAYSGTHRWGSAGGLRQYRPPEQKPCGRGVEANFESRSQTGRHWESNAHLDIEER